MSARAVDVQDLAGCCPDVLAKTLSGILTDHPIALISTDTLLPVNKSVTS